MKTKIIISLIVGSIIVAFLLFYNNVGFFYSLIRPNPAVEIVFVGENTEDNTESYKAEVFLSNDDRKLIFTYTKAKAHEVSFTLKEGNTLIQHDENGIKKIMELHKQAPYTVVDAIKAIAETKNKGLLAKGCTIKKTQENYWIIASSEENQIDCGEYSQPFDDSVTRYFTVIGDHFLAFIDKPNNNVINFEEVEIVCSN